MRQIAIIGSGPAGYYTAEAAQKQWGDDVRVDIFDMLPVPYGLIRTGVAPDHQRFGGEVQASTVCPLDGGRQRVVQRIILADETQHPGIRQAAHIVRVDLAAQYDYRIVLRNV